MFCLCGAGLGSITPDWARVTRSLGDGRWTKMRSVRGDGCVCLVDGVVDSCIDCRIDERGNPIPAKPPRLEQRQLEEDETPRSENINHQTPQRETARLCALFFPHPDGIDPDGGADGVHFADEEERCEAVDFEA